MALTPTRRPPAWAGLKPIPFHTTKYGPELLVDIAAVREMPAFVLKGPHILAFHDIILVTAGRGWFALDGYRYRVRPGAVFFTAPGQIRVWDVADLDGTCLFFPALFLEEFFNDPLFLERLGYFGVADGGGAIYLSAKRAARLAARLSAMQRELRRLRRDSVHLLRARVYETLITLSRAYSAARGEPAGPAPHPVTQRYLELLERGVSGRRRVGTYAKELAVSPGYLNTLCRRRLGRSAKDLIADRLVLEARRRLLYSDEPVGRIASALGFRDPSYFSRFFRARTGRSPRQFQREERSAG